MTEFPIHELDVIERQATHLIGTLGHVSEGKSTLVRALTGVKTQRYQKEQERNITIHLGYANCKVYQDSNGHVVAQKTSDAPPPNTQLVAHLSFVDCPGHEAFLATMLGGASIMDTAALIIAGNQEQIPQPQTLEHLIAAHLMGLERFVVLQNKLDLLTEEEAQTNHEQIKSFLKDTNAETAPLFPISAQHGWNTHHVLDCLLAMPPPSNGRNLQAPAHLTCVRSFDVNKPQQWFPNQSSLKGAVIGGTLQAGVLVPGDWLELRPGRLTKDAKGVIYAEPLFTQVKEIRCEEQTLPYAIPGSLIAIQTTMDPAFSAGNGLVGQRVGTPGTLPPLVGDLHIKFQTLKRDMFPFGKAKVGERVKVCSNVRTVEATIIEMPEKKERRLRLDQPLCCGEGETVAVLRFHKEAGRELLEGCGIVKGVEVWPDVIRHEAPQIEAQLQRKPKWIPMDKPSFSQKLPSYTDLLADLQDEKDDTKTKKLKLKEPILQRIPKHVIWANWQETVEAMANAPSDIPFSDHMKHFFDSELSTSSSINGQGQLIIAGNWKLNGICSVLRKYVNRFKTCRQCKSSEVGLVKEGKVLQLQCVRCKARSFVEA